MDLDDLVDLGVIVFGVLLMIGGSTVMQNAPQQSAYAFVAGLVATLLGFVVFCIGYRGWRRR